MLHMFLTEHEDDKHLLDMHLDDGLANQCGSEECPEWHQKMSTGNPRKVKQRIGNLKMYLILKHVVVASM